MRLHVKVVLFFLCIPVWACIGLFANTIEISQRDFYVDQSLVYVANTNKLLTGVIVYKYGNGAVESRRAYVNGIMDGVSIYYYADGVKKSEINYEKGKMTGVAQGWHVNGKLSFTGEYKRGKQHSLWKEWDESGILLSEKTYDADAKPKMVFSPPKPPIAR